MTDTDPHSPRAARHWLKTQARLGREAARPILLLGPRESHVGDILDVSPMGWSIRHGDVAGAVALLETLRAMPESELQAHGERGLAVLESDLSKQALCGRLCDVVERES